MCVCVHNVVCMCACRLESKSIAKYSCMHCSPFHLNFHKGDPYSLTELTQLRKRLSFQVEALNFIFEIFAKK